MPAPNGRLYRIVDGGTIHLLGFNATEPSRAAASDVAAQAAAMIDGDRKKGNELVDESGAPVCGLPAHHWTEHFSSHGIALTMRAMLVQVPGGFAFVESLHCAANPERPDALAALASFCPGPASAGLAITVASPTPAPEHMLWIVPVATPTDVEAQARGMIVRTRAPQTATDDGTTTVCDHPAHRWTTTNGVVLTHDLLVASGPAASIWIMYTHASGAQDSPDALAAIADICPAAR
jgi:hypothetical protein